MGRLKLMQSIVESLAFLSEATHRKKECIQRKAKEKWMAELNRKSCKKEELVTDSSCLSKHRCMYTTSHTLTEQEMLVELL